MEINVAHLREKSTTGGWIDFAVFDAKSTGGSSSDNAQILSDLVFRARSAGLKVDKGALAFEQNGRVHFYGPADVVEYLRTIGVPPWTHTIQI